MSEKEYEITKVGDGKYEVKEKQDYTWEYTAKTHMTRREKVGYKMLEMPKWKKIVLTAFFDWYGIRYRYGSNRGRAVAFSILQFFYSIFSVAFAVLLFLELFGIEDTGISIEDFYIVMPYYILWLIDLLSVISKERILFIGRKIYKDYKG